MNLAALHHRDRFGTIGKQRKRSGKSGPHADPLAFRGNRATVKFDEMTNDRQSQTETTKIPRRRTVRLTKTIEHARQKLRIDALTAVVHGHFRIRSITRHAHVDLAAVRRELYGIR